jgi:hypothetical protein
MTLLRTIRAPCSLLVLTGLGLLVPPQTVDMLAALEDGRSSISPTILFHLALAFLALSAWYWSRALLAARFGMPDDERQRAARLNAVAPQVTLRAYDIVPRLMYILSVLIGLGIIIRSGAWSNLAYLALWAIPLGFAVYFRSALVQRLLICLGRQPDAPHTTAGDEPSDPRGYRRAEGLCDWFRNIPHRLGYLIEKAPWPNWFSAACIVLSLLVFVWGSLDAFVPWPAAYPGLPALAAIVFPGPAVALVGLALIIAPLSVLTYIFDGLDVSFYVLGYRVLRRPPVMTVMVAWVLIAPTLFSVHTVRIVKPEGIALTPADRQDLGKLFLAWVSKCAPNGRVVRPIIVAVSGGASRAAIWGERVLYDVEKSTRHSDARIFAVSSVSGGSLGTAAYMAGLAALDDNERCSNIESNVALRDKQMDVLRNHQLSEDALGPLLAGALLVDIPRALFSPLPQVVRWLTGGEPRGGDRAEALERAFEHLWNELPPQDYVNDPQKRPFAFSKPYLSLFYHEKKGPSDRVDTNSIRAGMPIWIANGTDVATGGRLVTVPYNALGARPLLAAADVLASLGADVPISTAVNNTARFPYLEPSGELLPNMPDNGKELPSPGQRRKPDGSAREIIDGGYFDNEGLQTAIDLANWLQHDGQALLSAGRIVDPIIVQATGDGAVLSSEAVVRCGPRTDDPAEISVTRRPLQLLAPIAGLYEVRGGHAAVLLLQARAAFCPAEHQRFFHFYLPANGTTPVPLNWVLSDAMARYIWDGAMDAGGNQRELQNMRQALHGQ